MLISLDLTDDGVLSQIESSSRTSLDTVVALRRRRIPLLPVDVLSLVPAAMASEREVTVFKRLRCSSYARIRWIGLEITVRVALNDPTATIMFRFDDSYR